MNAAKQEGWVGYLLGPLRHLLRPLTGGSRGLFVAVALAVLMIVAAYMGWAKWGPTISSRDRFVLTVESLEIPRQPAWIPADIKAEVMRDGSLTGLSVLDPELTSQVARAFELNTWVSRVNRVVKRPGKEAPRVIIELDYRRPVVMVKTRNGFWPVDSEGVLLPPDDFSPSQTRSYLRVVTDNWQPAGPVGTPYGDSGINGAARIATAIDGIWADAGLQWIVVRKELPVDASQATHSTYLLYPIGNAPGIARTNSNAPQAMLASDSASSEPILEVRWGHAPGLESPGEATCTQKITRLEQFVQDYGPLHEQTGVRVIDLRSASGISIVGKKNGFTPAALRPGN
jgi:hypothetical protein